jgi:DNA uptake protein ComE-like DNA-binding protein
MAPASIPDFLNRIGARALYCKGQALTDKRERFITLLQTQYYQPMLVKMLSANQNLRRFLAARRVQSQDVRGQVVSFSAELSQKLVVTLQKHLASREEDGFKVLLPAYVQRSVHNAVIDFIRHESNWEKQTLQDVHLDPGQDDPRTAVADDVAYTPESRVLSNEQVGQLNELRTKLASMLNDGKTPTEPLTVVDCMFGLGLTPHSVAGQEMTMRECSETLKLPGETPARRIARCQVLLDKGLDLVRQKIYTDMPGIADAWQRGLNVNLASRRELEQQLGMTEGEVERCIKSRQYTCAAELVDKSVLKPDRLPALVKKGLVAAFVPVDLNSATNRDIVDIVGMPKDKAARVVAERPFKSIDELLTRKLVGKPELNLYIQRGAVVRSARVDSKRLDLNRVTEDEIVASGIDTATATTVVKLRPFLTWAELEEFLGPESQCLPDLRQKFYLGLSSG